MQPPVLELRNTLRMKGNIDYQRLVELHPTRTLVRTGGAEYISKVEQQRRLPACLPAVMYIRVYSCTAALPQWRRGHVDVHTPSWAEIA
jgi:hypothetical protein